MKVKLTGQLLTGQLRLQMKRLLGNQFARRENSRLAIRVITISERDLVEEDERGADERKGTQKVYIRKERCRQVTFLMEK